MPAQLVKIIEYSAVKGKGVAMTTNGEKILFTYRNLLDQRRIPVGSLAVLTEDATLRPAARWSWPQWALKRMVRWQ